VKDNADLIARLQIKLNCLYDDVEENENNYGYQEGAWEEIDNLKARIERLKKAEAVLRTEIDDLGRLESNDFG